VFPLVVHLRAQLPRKFCGAAVIGADLQTMSRKYTKGGVTFSLHKENF